MTAPTAPTTIRWGLPAALLVLVGGFAGAVLGSSLAVSIWGTRAATNAWAVSLIFATQAFGAIAAMTWVTTARGQQSFARDFGLRAYVVDLIWLPAGVGLQILGNLVVLPVMEIMDRHQAAQGVARTLKAAPAPAQALLGLSVVVVAPIVEELMFRGVLLRALQRHTSAPLAVLVSALAFAGLHMLDGGAWIVLPALFAVGTLAGFLANRTGRLGPPIALHAGFNLLALAAILLT